MQTPIVVGNHVFGCIDFGVVTCFDTKTGAVSYSERLTPAASLRLRRSLTGATAFQ
jgi:hypothetical protein